MVDGEGGSSEGCLKWGVGVIKGSFKKHLETGGGYRQKLPIRGRGFEVITTSAPSRKILIIHQELRRVEKCVRNESWLGLN